MPHTRPTCCSPTTPDREAAILRYVKDLGLNMIRLEGKFPGEHIVEKADELGIPLMFGWMCCNQWEKWAQWDDEDRSVAARQPAVADPDASVPSVGVHLGQRQRRPAAARGSWRNITRSLTILHWQNATVDTVSSLATRRDGERDWDGIQMAGPYSWRPPSYWFSGRYAATRGSTAEQGDNEHIPPFASLKKFIPPDKLWPINDTWSFHAGSNANNASLTASSAPSTDATGRPTMPRSSPAKPNSRIMNRRAPSSRRSPRTVGTATR